jgi:hemolysin activation/secretion protein
VRQARPILTLPNWLLINMFLSKFDRLRRFTRPGAPCLAALLLPAIALAQTAPAGPVTDPAAILRRQVDEVKRSAQPSAAPVDPLAAEAAPAPAHSALRFKLATVAFSPSVLLDAASLEQIAKPYLGREVVLADLNDIVAQVNALYRSRNILSGNAVLPPQDIKDGEVRILLVEGKLGSIKVEGNAYLSERYASSFILQAPGQTIQADRLSQSVQRFNATNQSTVSVRLLPGAQPGESDIVLDVTEARRLQGSVFVDNYGAPSISREQVTTTLKRYANLTAGDRVDLFLIGARGNLTGWMGYDLPLDRYGTRLATSVSRNRININEIRPGLALTGHSQSAAMELSHPLYLNVADQLRATLSYTHTDSDSAIGGVAAADSKIERWSTGLTFDHSAQGARVVGVLAPSFVKWRLIDGTRESASYVDLNVSAYLQTSPATYLRGSFSGRHASQDVLVSSELFQVGGPSSVRGYSAGIIGGASGYSGQGELHYQAMQGVDTFVFYNYGRITSAQLGAVSSWGVGANWVPCKICSLDIFAARRINRDVPGSAGVAVYARAGITWN